MEQVGLVVKTEDGIAEMIVRRVSSCGGGGCKSCASSCDVKPDILKVVNTLDAKVGDYVELRANNGMLLKYTLLIYGLPMLFLVIGSIIGITLFKDYPKGELYGAVFGLFVMAISFLIIKIIDGRKKESLQNIVVMVKKL